MTKQEKIQEAYRDYYQFYQDNKYDEEGYVIITDPCHEIWGKITLDKHPYNNHVYRPFVLKGIETNNGWIKIESEIDLPKDNGIYFFYCLDADYVFASSQDVVDRKGLIELYEDFEITHYQPIQQPEPPLF